MSSDLPIIKAIEEETEAKLKAIGGRKSFFDCLFDTLAEVAIEKCEKKKSEILLWLEENPSYWRDLLEMYEGDVEEFAERLRVKGIDVKALLLSTDKLDSRFKFGGVMYELAMEKQSHKNGNGVKHV